MTEPNDRTAEIIAAYGADPARWPDAERAAALAAIARDPALTATLRDARVLDADLRAWALAPVAPGDWSAAARVAMHRPHPVRRWAVGTGIAASLAAAMLLAPGHTPIAVPVQVATDDAAAFSQVFTPTPDEEQLL